MKKTTRIAVSVVVTAVFSAGITSIVAAQEIGCSPCHYCPWDDDLRQVLPQGASTVESPDRYIRIPCYENCPETSECDPSEESPEAALADALLALDLVRPDPSKESPFHLDAAGESGFPVMRPTVIRSSCGTRVERMPVFTDLIPAPRESPANPSSSS